MHSAEPHRRRWDRGEYERLAALGFFRGRRVELIQGEIIQMPPMRNDHAVALGLAEERLRAVFAAGYWVRPQMPLHLGRRSAPEPDLAVVPGSPRDYADHPTDAVLVVEVSDTTLAYDRGRKAVLYAAAAIPEYWIVNLVDRTLVVHRQPRRNAARPRRSSYRVVANHGADEVIAPLARPDAAITVADLLP